MKRSGRQANLAASLGGLMRRLDRKSGGAYASARATAAWVRVAGPLVSGHTTGAHLRDGELVVYVDGSIWATELSAMAERYRTSVNEEIGEELVREVRFTVSRKVARQQQLDRVEEKADEFYREGEVPSVPLSEIELAQVAAAVSVISDSELREAALRATVKDLEWKKGMAARNGREAARESL